MKKIISLLVSVCALASVFTTAAYATVEKPTMKLVAEKINFVDDKYDVYDEYASDYDWTEYNSDAVGGSYDTYSLKVVATGLEIKTEAVKSGKSTIYVGDSITGYQLKVSIDTDAEYDMDWKWGLIKSMGSPVGAPNDTGAALVSTGTVALEPAPKTAKTITKDMETVVAEFLVTVDAGKDVNFSLDNYAVFLATYPDTSKNPTDTSEYKMSEGTMVTTTPTFTLPVKEEPPVEDDTLKITISDPMAITAGDVNGIAWDVDVKNFDSTKEYRAYFTSNGEVRNPDGQRIEFDIETSGDFDFAAILSKTLLDAEDTVDFEIKY